MDAEVSLLFGHRSNRNIDVAYIQAAPKFSNEERAGGDGMKILLSPRGLFVLGFMVLAATNIIVLFGVASNRSGNHDSQIILTERELQLPYQTYQIHKENSGLSLRLDWRTLGKDEENINYMDRRSPAWFNAEKLEELGFKINDNLSSKGNKTYSRQSLPKEVFIVLENDGEPYRAAVKRVEVAFEKEDGLLKADPEDKRLRGNFERAEKKLKHMRITESRLYAVDAGLDPQKLRKKYEDQTRFIIAKGLVKPIYRGDNKGKEVVGNITKISIENIHVPLNYKKMFDVVLAQGKLKHNECTPPRYKVELAYGSRLEPWIMSVEAMDDTSDNK